METPLVYGHRGASAVASENTLEAFELARAQGADGVELDVRRSADGHLVLNHDPDLVDGRRVASTSSADLPSDMPTLAQALDVCHGMIVNIEIKNIPGESDFDDTCALADEVVELLHARNGVDRVLLSCFHLATIDRVRQIDASLATGFLTLLEPTAIDGVPLAATRGHGAIHPYHLFVDEVLVAAAHEAGLAVNAWTVNEPDDVRRLVELGVDGIVTDVPDVVRSILSG